MFKQTAKLSEFEVAINGEQTRCLPETGKWVRSLGTEEGEEEECLGTR